MKKIRETLHYYILL